LPLWWASRWACRRAITAASFDTGLSFLANLVLAFPVILLFYLLVTPEIVSSGMPQYWRPWSCSCSR
jgi:hypothetical protein